MFILVVIAYVAVNIYIYICVLHDPGHVAVHDGVLELELVHHGAHALGRGIFVLCVLVVCMIC